MSLLIGFLESNLNKIVSFSSLKAVCSFLDKNIVEQKIEGFVVRKEDKGLRITKIFSNG